MYKYVPESMIRIVIIVHPTNPSQFNLPPSKGFLSSLSQLQPKVNILPRQ
jgi:hypothetical protein